MYNRTCIEQSFYKPILNNSFMRKKYVGIALPIALINRMDEFIKKDRWGYKSRAELAKDGIRRLVSELERYKK